MKNKKKALMIPGTALVLGAALAAALILIPGPGPRRAREKIWSIGIYSGSSPLDLAPVNTAGNPVLSAAEVTDVPALFVADPFVIRADGVWHMFFEVFNTRSNQGDIGLATSRDGFDWKYEKIVLDEPHHLSYPAVFHWKGVCYMLPESRESGALRLYSSSRFPDEWQLAGELLRGDFVDPTLFVSDGRLWLFAETNPKGNDRLSLFSAEDLMGPWTEHPRSPIVNGDRTMARPAGRVLRFGERIIRYAQVDAPDYGRRIRAFEITELDAGAFREREVVMKPGLKASGRGWNADGMHHLDPHPVPDGRWVAYVDGYFYRPEPSRNAAAALSGRETR